MTPMTPGILHLRYPMHACMRFDDDDADDSEKSEMSVSGTTRFRAFVACMQFISIRSFR